MYICRSANVNISDQEYGLSNMFFLFNFFQTSHYKFNITLLLLLFLFNISALQFHYWREWIRIIIPKTPTPETEPIEERKIKKKQWKTKRERAAQVNYEALTLLFKDGSPTPSNTESTRSLYIDTE